LPLGVAGKSLFIVTGLEWIRERGPRAVTDGWLSGLLLFLGVDLGYYLFHRASHRVRVLWAIHESHHSSERMNFSVALRQPPLEPLVDWLFFIGLAWLGFSAKAILTVYAFNLFYQFFIHTEVIRRLAARPRVDTSIRRHTIGFITGRIPNISTATVAAH
jgi:sterol desaturase/sphingolipid hydroxylase (fatty acid hydroxylase superfamily)